MSAINFYPSEEFEWQVAELVKQGWSRAAAVERVTLVEEQDAVEYHAWAEALFA